MAERMTRRTFGMGMSGVVATVLLGATTTEETSMPPDAKKPKDTEPDRRPFEEPN